MRLWPRTLGVQLIVVISLAIFMSNAAVALWFELSRERQNEADILERMVDRTRTLATMMSSIPPRARVAAATAMEGRFWHYRLQSGNRVDEPMTPDEAKLAARLKAAITSVPHHPGSPVEVHFRFVQLDGPPNISTRPPGEQANAIEMTVPVVRGTVLIATFVRPPGPPWPAEMMIASVLAFVAASLAAAYIARRVARPLSKLADAAAVVGQGQAAPRVPEVGPDDVRNAAQAFNAMTDQVTRTLESQRHLLSAVGHDLRTPITAMRINIEFVEDPELRDRLQRNLDELADLTEAVLSAAKGSSGEARRQIDLAALVESVCADLDDLGEPVTFQPQEPAPLSCRPGELRRAIRNLIENAVTYGKKADVSIAVSPGAFEVIVDDEGPGISPEDRSRVFEPFVRLERSRNVETGGTGLGLTLVKAIAEGHGGKVVLEDRPGGGGLRVRLVLPRVAGTTTSPPAKALP